MASSQFNDGIRETQSPKTGKSKTTRPWQPYLETFALAKVSIAIALIVCGLLNVDQAMECLVVLTQDIETHNHFLKPLLTLGALWWLATMLWYWSRFLQDRFLGDEETRGVQVLRRWLPRVIGVLPFAGMLAALVRAGAEYSAILIVVDVIGAGLFIWQCVLHRKAYIRKSKTQPGLSPTSLRTLWITGAIMVAAGFVFTTDAQLAQHFGALAIILAAATGWVVVLGVITFWEARLSLPFLLLGLVWLLFCSLLNTNDNHRIRHLDLAGAAPTTNPAPSKMEETFEQWLANRPDAKAYEGQPYPVVLIATEGGGIYAAYHTGIALAELQDTQPAFAQHVFAISGVSGGSVGAALFAALVADGSSSSTMVAHPTELKKTGPMLLATSTFFDPDYLAPLVAKAFYPDLVQRFNVFPIEAADRTRALEQSLEEAWLRVQAKTAAKTTANRFDSNFNDLWPDFTHGITPALLLNTTEVETGRQLVVSNLGAAGFQRPHMFFADHPSSVLRLSTAAVLSARFPLVTSAGDEPAQVRGPTSDEHRYVDGGYFENSGVGTLSDVIAAVLPKQYAKSAKPSFRLIVVQIALNDELAAQQDSQSKDETKFKPNPRLQFSQSTFEEIGSPVRALLNTRAAREESALARMHAIIDPPPSNCTLIQLFIADEQRPLPLGWLLSEKAKDEIKSQLEKPTRQLLKLAQSIEP